MSSPCETCLVRAICKHLCKNWWRHSNTYFSVNSVIDYSDFVKKVNPCGPLNNEFKEIYEIVDIALLPKYSVRITVEKRTPHGFSRWDIRVDPKGR
jgi:hypothetical protein